MKLNRTGSIWNRDERNKINDNWDKLERNTNDFQGEITDKVFAEIKDSAKLNWESPVNNFSALSNGAKNGETRFTRDTGKVYRYDGKNWKEIQELDLSPITEVESRVNSQVAEIDDELFKSSLVNHKIKRFNVWWIDDDGHKGVYTKIAPILREYRIKMSSAVITNRPHGFPIDDLPSYDTSSQFMSYQQMKELEEEGIVEFVPHSHTHDLNYRYTDMTVDEIHEDMSKCKSIMRRLGWNHKDLVFPFGAHNEQVREVARQYFRSGVDIKGGAFVPPVNQFMLPRQGMDTTDTQDIINEINKAYENNTLIILMSHVDQYGGLEESKMRAVIEHVQSLGGKFITGEEAITNYGNLLQIGDDSISFDGGMHGNRLGKVRVTKDNEFLASNVPDDFEAGITLTKIDQNPISNTDGFPLRMYGSLVTVKSSHLNNWTHQTFYAGYRNLTAYRHSISGNDWSNWYVNYMPDGQGVLPDSSPPKDYPIGVTTTTVTSPNASNTPFNRGGIIKTTKTHDNYIWTYQEFFDVTNNEKYTRRADSLDAWRDWEKVKQSYHKSENEINGSTPISAYKEGITHGYVRANSSGLPSGTQSGNLVTYKQNGATRSYQTFRVAAGFDKYIRTDLSDGSWSRWQKFVLEEV